MRPVRAVGDFISKHFGMLILMVAVVACIVGIRAAYESRVEVTRTQDTSPSELKLRNDDRRRQWVLDCIDYATGRGETLSVEGIAQCGWLGDKFFPEQDWEHVAMINWEKQTLGSSPDP